MIRFHCPTCGKHLQTPDELDSKLVECPKCGSEVRVPSYGNIPPPKPKPAAGQEDREVIRVPLADIVEVKPNPAAVKSEAGMIRFHCPTCGSVLDVPDELSSKTVGCSFCGRPHIRVPSKPKPGEVFWVPRADIVEVKPNPAAVEAEAVRQGRDPPRFAWDRPPLSWGALAFCITLGVLLAVATWSVLGMMLVGILREMGLLDWLSGRK